MAYFKLTALWVLSFVFFLNLTVTHAQFLENLLGTGRNNVNTSSRDDIFSPDNSLDELTFEEVICRDIETFPKTVSSRNFRSYPECKSRLDYIENASYVDLTYRIRRDDDRLDLFQRGIREIYICDGAVLTRYEHQGRKDPDWWMIVRNSPELLNCSQEISGENID